MSTIITQNPYTFTVEDNMNINAVFEDNTYTINAYIFSPTYTPSWTTSQLKANGSGTYSPGETCSLSLGGTNASNINYFAGWYDFETGEKISTSKNYTFTPTKSQDIYGVCGNDDTGGFINGYKRVGLKTGTVGLNYTLTATDVNENTTTQTNSGSTSSGEITVLFSSLPYISDIKYLSFKKNSGYDVKTYIYAPFNLIHDQDHPLDCEYVSNSGLVGTSTYVYGWMFGPREGSTIYLAKADPNFTTDTYTNRVELLVFTQHTAPNFNIKMNITRYSNFNTIYVPSDGVGYNNDWIDANFTYNTRPTITKKRFR